MPHNGMMAQPKAKNFKGTVKQLSIYIRPYYLRIILSLLLMVTSTIMCIYGPLLTGNATTLIANGLLNKYEGGSGIDFEALGKIIKTCVIIYLTSAIIDYIVNVINVDIAVSISYKLRDDIQRKINKLPLKYFDSKTHGEVLSRVTNDVDNISNNLTSVISQVLNSLINIVGVIAMMIMLSIKLTIISLIVIPLTGILAATVVKKSQKYFKANQEYLGKVNGHIEEMYSGHLIVKSYNYEEKSLKTFNELNDKLYEAGFKSQFISSLIRPVTSILGNIGYVAVCLIGGFEVIQGRMTIGNIQSFTTYVRRLNQPISSIAQLLNTAQSMVAASERVFEILNEKEEEKDPINPLPVLNKDNQSIIKGAVKFDHVKFGYKEDKIIIKDFSMDIKPGDNIAIVGPTGAGKTTLVKLLMRFYELNDGAIYIDGNNIKDYTKDDLRSQLGMVLQDAWLFDGTIKDNIKFGNPEASDEEMFVACKMAHVDHFIKTLENGYDTVVSEDTSSISQGQKQLLTIARAFLKDPKILILDEATSSVDTRTEQLIQDSMVMLRHGRTAFTIAHRLSTIRSADSIIVLNEGDIVEVGNHEELLKKNGFYAKLYNSQFEN